MSSAEFLIVEIVYSGMTQLDFTGPHTVFSRLPGVRTIVASLQGGDVESDGGLVFGRTIPLREVERCDLLFAPGGVAAPAVANDPAFLDEVIRLAKTARYLSSVCTGSLILGAAGLLEGKRAACHWAWRDMLPLFGAIPDAARVVRDGNLITGGGVTAGIDFALTVAAELAGADVAQALQLGIEYAPAPPFDSGRPDTAPPHVLAMVNARNAETLPARRAEAEKAAGRLRRVRE